MNTFQNLAEELKSRVCAYDGTMERLAAKSKVSLRWLSLFKNGHVPNATVKQLDRVNNALLKATRQ